jgi:hypothetical protein
VASSIRATAIVAMNSALSDPEKKALLEYLKTL